MRTSLFIQLKNLHFKRLLSSVIAICCFTFPLSHAMAANDEETMTNYEETLANYKETLAKANQGDAQA